MEIAEENKLNYGGPMALVFKTNSKEYEYEEDMKEDEEVFILNFDDEAISYYSINRVKFFQEAYRWKFQKQLREEANIECWWNSKSIGES